MSKKEKTPEQKKKEVAPLLIDADDASSEHEYINPNIETKLPVHKRQDCRDIVMEIKKFGVSQRQILYLIYLLALELENVALMKEITKLIGDRREEVPVSNLILPE